MPEGPEITMLKHYLKYKLLNSYITNIEVKDGRYLKKDIEGVKLIETYPLKIISIDSKGKFMWFTLESKNNLIYMIATFGLTGVFNLKEKYNEYPRVLFKISKKNKLLNLYFDDKLQYGTLKFTNKFEIIEKKLNELEIDLLSSNYDHDVIKNKIKNIKNNLIVEVLMNQNKSKSIGCGLGNYLVSEILYFSKISPHRYIHELTNKEIKDLTYAIKYILCNAFYNNSSGYMENFKSFIYINKTLTKKGKFERYLPEISLSNSKFKFNVYSKSKDNLGNEVKKETILKDRKTYWVEKIQK